MLGPFHHSSSFCSYSSFLHSVFIPFAEKWLSSYEGGCSLEYVISNKKA